MAMQRRRTLIDLLRAAGSFGAWPSASGGQMNAGFREFKGGAAPGGKPLVPQLGDMGPNLSPEQMSAPHTLAAALASASPNAGRKLPFSQEKADAIDEKYGEGAALRRARRLGAGITDVRDDDQAERAARLGLLPGSTENALVQALTEGQPRRRRRQRPVSTRMAGRPSGRFSY